MRLTSKERAAQCKVAHVFLPGTGYFEVGPMPMPAVRVAGMGALPRGSVADGSRHILRTPSGAELAMLWMAAEQAWERTGGYRMAFTADYLSAHGWTYLGAALALEA